MPRTSTSSVDRLGDALEGQVAGDEQALAAGSTAVVVKVIGPLFSTSKKSPERRWASRFSSRVLIEFRSIVAVARAARRR